MLAEVSKIQDILESKFSIENYVSLVNEIFTTSIEIAPYNYRREYSNYSSHIEGYSHVANYMTPDNKKIIILAVELKSDSYVENARSTQRSFAKKLIENSNAEAAVVAFYTSGESKWRLSFVHLDYEMKFEKGKLRAIEDITPARRFSFLVGEDEPSHTAVERLSSFITDKNAQPTLADLEEVFSVEKVTKEFFELYRDKYLELLEYLKTDKDFIAESEKCKFTVEQFAKKLLGQIVFLYFLQKKGWLGVHVWPNDLTEKEYNNVYYTKGFQGRLIKEYIPKLYVKNGEIYKFIPSAIDLIPDDAEEAIANNLPKNKTGQWGEGSKKFLRRLFNFSKRYDDVNFYNDYLEPLFYNTLNINRGVMGYSSLLHCRIPFLSGGLFEPIKGYDWKISKLNIPNEIFSDEKTKNGILDIFDRYNFTMCEDEPMEREVAIDPEMLGKVFENLLDVTDRKSKGAFYTPREIVHYMCQESLITYLTNTTGLQEKDIRDFILYGDFMKDEDTAKNKWLGNSDMYISEEIFKIDANGKIIKNRLYDLDEALANIRVADPAAGSGAFLVGMLNEIVRARQNLTNYMSIIERFRAISKEQAGYYIKELYRSRTPYTLKLYAIKNCLYAVDIEPSAVDIAQLRLWLSLVIDDELNPQATNILDGHRDPLPLPNLECNILCGNSLLDEFEGYPLINQSDLINTSQEGQQYNLAQNEFESVLPTLINVQDELFYCENPVKKMQLLDQLSELKDKAIEPQLFMMPPDVRMRYEDSKLDPSRPYILWQLEFAKVFHEKGGFDIVIGNPPYIQLQKCINEETQEKVGDIYQNAKFSTFTKTGDIYCLFYEKGYELLHDNGVLSFITSNKWMRAGYGEKLRKFLASKTNPIILVDFAGQKVFESATVDVCILIYTKQKNQHKTHACIVKDACWNNLSVFIMQNSFTLNFNNEETWSILSPIEQNIKMKIDSLGTPLQGWDIAINYGIKTGFNDAFIIDTVTKDRLIAEDPKSAEIIRPILRGRDIKRYGYDFANLWLIATFPSFHYDINDYPAVKNHLLSFGIERLEQTGNKYIRDGQIIHARKKTNNKWFETQDSINYWEDFSKQKIVYREISNAMNACLVEPYIMVNNKCYFITGNHLIYLLAYFNSSLFTKIVIPEVNETGGKGNTFINSLKVIKPSQDIESLIINLYNKYSNNEIDITLYDNMIDRIFCDIYNLSYNEREYIMQPN